jgi:hypothetical protein
MTFQYIPGEAFLLRELLSDAHRQIRELRAQVDRLTAALVTRSLSDRRRAVMPHVERRVGDDRRRPSVWAFQSKLNLHSLAAYRITFGDSSRES